MGTIRVTPGPLSMLSPGPLARYVAEHVYCSYYVSAGENYQVPGNVLLLSVNSKPDHPPPGKIPRQFFDVRIPHPRAEKSSKPHPPGL